MSLTVAVYGASSSRIDAAYVDAAKRLGALLAQMGAGIVCGGGCAGLMAAVTDGALEQGGRVTGVLPEFMIEKGWAHPGLTERIVTDGMHTRKATMLGRAGAVIALPGGIGTFEELFEAMTWRQLNLWSGPIVILNTCGYYDSILAQLRRADTDSFMRPCHRSLFAVASTPEEAARLVAEPDTAGPFEQKID
nr:TIGR00730 family Rossman fold protein [Bacteroides sp.]